MNVTYQKNLLFIYLLLIKFVKLLAGFAGKFNQFHFHIGLVLQLDVEPHEYVYELTNEEGVRVVLHEQGSTPFPDEEGFSVASGGATSVGLKKVHIQLLHKAFLKLFLNCSIAQCHSKWINKSKISYTVARLEYTG